MGESGWLLQSRIVEFAKEMKKSKMVFGTDSPPNEPGMWARELEVLCHQPPQGLNLSEDDLEGYLGNNMAKMLGLQPTPPPKSEDEAKAYLRGDIPQASADNSHADHYSDYEPSAWAEEREAASVSS